MEYKAGLGDRDTLVANRIAANIIGILAAVFMSMIPPRVMGSSPKYTKLLFQKASHGLSEAARLLADDANENQEAAMRELHASFVKETNALRSDARFLLEDAKRLNSFPFLHVDPKLEDELDGLTITCAGIASVMEQAADLLGDSQQPSSDSVGAQNVALEDLREALKAIARGETQADLDLDPRLGGSVSENLVALYEILQSRLSDHRIAFDTL